MTFEFKDYFFVLGTFLSVYNTWTTYRGKQVRIKVSPYKMLIPQEASFLGIKVVNLSLFPVTITSVGLRVQSGESAFIFDPRIVEGLKLPVKLEPRSSFTALATDFSNISSQEVKGVYAETTCGVIAEGKNKHLKRLIEDLKN